MNKVDILLINHNIIPGYKGYEYIKYILLNEERTINNISVMELYRNISNNFNTTVIRVERAIRHIISKSNLDIKKNKQALALLQIEYEGK